MTMFELSYLVDLRKDSDKSASESKEQKSQTGGKAYFRRHQEVV